MLGAPPQEKALRLWPIASRDCRTITLAVRFAPLFAALSLASCTTTMRASMPDASTHDDASTLDDRSSAPPADCAAMGSRALSSLTQDFYRWDHDAPSRADLAWPLPPSCGTLRSTAPWLRLEGAEAARSISIDPSALSTGLHRASIELVASDTTVIASASVRLRLFRAPSADATRKVLVVGYDGARSDAMQAASTPVLDFLLRSASWSFDARTQLAGPTVSAAGWMSAFTGVDPSRHGIVANGDYSTRVPVYRTFVARAVDAGRTAVVSTAWEEVTTQIVEGSLRVERYYQLDPFAARWLAGRLRTSDASLFFQHLNDPDAAGHSTGFSAANPAYIRAIEGCDANLGVLIDGVLARSTVANESWLFVLTTDHGGFGTMHGALDDDNRRIWFVAAGAGAMRGEIPTGASQMDTAPTALRWLGVSIDSSWMLQGVARAQ